MGPAEVFGHFFSNLLFWTEAAAGRIHFITVQRESQYKIAASGRILSQYNEYKSGVVIIIKNKQNFETAYRNSTNHHVTVQIKFSGTHVRVKIAVHIKFSGTHVRIKIA